MLIGIPALLWIECMSAVLTGSRSACFHRSKKRNRERMEPFNMLIAPEAGPGIWIFGGLFKSNKILNL